MASAAETVVAGMGLVLVGMAFLRLGRTNTTDRTYLLALEYGFSLSLVATGLGLVTITAITSVLGI